MMDSAAVVRDHVSSLSTHSSEQTVRLGAAHGDAKHIGMLFFSPQRERIATEAPPLSGAFFQDMPDSVEVSASDETVNDIKPRASWLDALSDHTGHNPADERVSTFNPDDNGLYRMFLPETV
ncbi:hypothetical protein H4S14_003148 [Agrobacterium vitis]|nr:hypothetical protein [Agrobacterium vitis]MBE1439385.1 hypothetical protein [Agrobacterium vitis]